MLSKELTPKAVNIIRPTRAEALNYSSSTDSSTSFSFTTSSASTTSPMIRQPSVETNPGLSFFCQSPLLKQPPPQQQLQQQQIHHASFEKIQSQPPLVISRINLTRKHTTDPIDDIDTEESIPAVKQNPVTPPITQPVKLPSFKTGFGIMTGGLASFMLRGNITSPVLPDDARANRKIQDLEIEKKSLLTLNQTLETVVKEQSNTIHDLQDRLAAIERPLTPGLDTSTSKNGIMSCTDLVQQSSDLQRCLEDEDAAFERIRIMLLDLIEQAQSAVLQNKKVVRVTEAEATRTRPRSVLGTRNSITPNRSAAAVAGGTRRTSLGSINNTHHANKQISFSPTTSPIPHRRSSIQRTPSSTIMTKSASNSSMHSTYSNASSTTSRASKYSIKKERDSTPKKWSN
ncbi:hypothetical protein INT47_011328 [Mucor saturninus]|uniref:Uncharacterized protein n=1 Tax=Mucor saturninus TaxID=64648 RepID=A0A8H7RKI0_9FUNG|nr:hypothetical protein INT47_011328 [Mucor saturninus]